MFLEMLIKKSFSKPIENKIPIEDRIIDNDLEKRNLSNLKRVLSLLNKATAMDKYKKIQETYNKRKSGLDGENEVLHILKYYATSTSSFYVFHNISFDTEIDNKTQIDFIIITQSNIIVVENKNFKNTCTITVNSDQTFVKSAPNSDDEKIESPYEQNERHLQALFSFFESMMKKFDSMSDDYAILRHLSNPEKYINICTFSGKACLDTTNAPGEIQNCVIPKERIKDKLNSIIYTKKHNIKKFYVEPSPKQIFDFLKKVSLPGEIVDWYAKFNINSGHLIDLSKLSIYHELKEFRLSTYRENSIKAYEVFNDNQIEALIKYNPRSLADIINTPTEGKYKFNFEQVMKYGNDILTILRKYEDYINIS